jgi:hypothetical protein
MVVDWETGPAGSTAEPPGDPWQQSRQSDTRQAMLLLKRVLMSVLAKEGIDLPSGPDGPEVRMVNQEVVREEFYARTAADGTPAQKTEFKRKRFNRALNRAEEMQLIGIREINNTVYLWLMPVDAGGKSGIDHAAAELALAQAAQHHLAVVFLGDGAAPPTFQPFKGTPGHSRRWRQRYRGKRDSSRSPGSSCPGPWFSVTSSHTFWCAMSESELEIAAEIFAVQRIGPGRWLVWVPDNDPFAPAARCVAVLEEPDYPTVEEPRGAVVIRLQQPPTRTRGEINNLDFRSDLLD